MSTTPEWGVSRDAVPEGFTQFTIYDTVTGRRIATVFDEDAVNLIAAAPDFQAACQEFVDKVENGAARSVQSYSAMRAALDKSKPKRKSPCAGCVDFLTSPDDPTRPCYDCEPPDFDYYKARTQDKEHL